MRSTARAANPNYSDFVGDARYTDGFEITRGLLIRSRLREHLEGNESILVYLALKRELLGFSALLYTYMQKNQSSFKALRYCKFLNHLC